MVQPVQRERPPQAHCIHDWKLQIQDFFWTDSFKT